MADRKKAKEPAEDQTRSEMPVGEWAEVKKPLRRKFPGPERVDEPLRLAFERIAFAELIAHAKEGLDEEVCGVLAGQVCKDRRGIFVQVEAAVRGTASRQGKTHVTFTHETWDQVHQAMQRDYPAMQIVGWYHSHPGFGVEFSEMDLFVQRNFFAGPTQFALVTDPLKGDMAACINTPEGICYLSRFWVDGREHPCRLPAAQSESSPQAGEDRLSQSLEKMEADIGRAIEHWEEQWASTRQLLNTILLLLMFVAAGLAVVIGQQVHQAFFGPLVEPPTLRQYLPLQLNINGKESLLGIGIYDWAIPEELRSRDLGGAPADDENGKPAARTPDQQGR